MPTSGFWPKRAETMRASRWALILLVALAGVVAFLFATRPPERAPDATIPERHVAASRPLQAGAPVDTAAAAPPVPAAASTTARPSALMARARPLIGSEGYGPHIDRAQAGNDAAAAWEAVQWLRSCASNEERRSSIEQARNRGVVPEALTQMMVELDEDARRCQTVTPQHRALLPGLAIRAMRAGEHEASAALAGDGFVRDLTPAERQQLIVSVRQEAQAGNLPTLLNAAAAHDAWGLGAEERLAFLAAYAKLAGPSAKAMVEQMLRQGTIRFRAEPTPEQLAAAKAAAQQIVARAQAAR